MGSSYRNSLDQWLRELEVKADSVLDIGGSQLPVKGRTKSWDVKKYLIADLSDPHVDSPKPDIELDLNSTEMPEDYGQYDLVFCLEVFEYVYNPWAAFRTLAGVMKKGATAWVSFPSFYPLHQPIDDDALRYMPAGIVKLANAHYLKLEEMIKRRPETNALQQFFSAERLRAAKGEDHAFTGFICRFTK